MWFVSCFRGAVSSEILILCTQYLEQELLSFPHGGVLWGMLSKLLDLHITDTHMPLCAWEQCLHSKQAMTL